MGIEVQNINEFFKYIRNNNEQKLTLRDVSKYVNFTSAELCRIENGKHNICLPTIISLCKAYNFNNEDVIDYYMKIINKSYNSLYDSLEKLTKEELIHFILSQEKMKKLEHELNDLKEFKKIAKKLLKKKTQ